MGTFYLYQNLLHIFWKNSQIPNFMKICPLGAEFLHADGLADKIKDEADSSFSEFRERIQKPTSTRRI
jgi:hypothetical protein